MIRHLYQTLLYLHPPAFREQFGDEMLWIFDETAGGGGTIGLLGDGAASALRQWFVGYEVWKVLPAVIYWAAQLTVMVGMLASRGFK